MEPSNALAGTLIENPVAAPGTAETLPDLPGEDRVPVKKLDLSRLSAPENLEEARLESLTIDGICGVY